MKLKKLLSILLAVALVLAMSVSVSASKRVDVNGEIVIGTLEWSGIPKETEYLAATMKMRISDPAYILTATVSGVFTPNSAAPGVAFNYPPQTLSGPNGPGGLGVRIHVDNAYWIQGDGDYVARYGDQYNHQHETKYWNVQL